MRFLPAGYSGLLVECDDLAQVIALHRALERARPDGVVDLVPAARTLLLTFEPGTTHARLADAVARVDLDSADQPQQHREVTIEVTYEGADLAEVAELTGIPAQEVVRRHQEARYVVAFTGFAPGFAYLAGGDPALVVPRRSTPRTKVPAGSVALAGEFTGVYPREGPGGWQLIGRTGAPLWDLDRDPPALLSPGTTVRFTEATR
jgi:KipI family sensor histidine kinase inhibitor